MGVTAFIPVRGGSKSIPLKNIKPFCGKPLVYWTVRAAVNASFVDRVVVATDSPEIRSAVEAFALPRVEVYWRKPENARDTSSTESVMLEYLAVSGMADSDVFLLIQATSPLLDASDLENGWKKFSVTGVDSVLSAVRCKRFFWNEKGESLNYDFRNRPRRQEFDGMLMENGAFYLNRVGGIRRDGNRLSGRIAVSEMPEFTALEIDEPDDWLLMEALMRRYRLPRLDLSGIRLVLTDVDGVLTDGGMYYSENGDEMKKFNTRDGMGFERLRNAGIKTGIITSENTRMVERRAGKIHADFLCQGRRADGKLGAASEICDKLGIPLSATAYIGDDVNCAELLRAVGAAACPADAQPEIKAIPGIIELKTAGGDGAFREFADQILGTKKCR